MDLGSALLSVCVMMLYLLGAARYSSGDKISCPCPEIPQMTLTESPPRTCFQINDSFRYTCIAGYLRKAGTSSLTKCKQIDGLAKWAPLSLQCIPDARRTPTEPPKNMVTTASTSRRMTESISTSASVTAETGSAEESSPGPQGLSELSSTNVAMITIASLLFIFAVIGMSSVCYRRRTKRNIPQHQAEEQICMNHDPCASAS